MSLPKAFCWTRFGTEAGQSAEDIFKRKDDERERNGGIFLWGIGNSVAPSIPALLKAEKSPQVVFSPIKSPPRACDASPEGIAVWNGGVGFDGKAFSSPVGSLVTSHLHGTRKSRHYALICRSYDPLQICASEEKIDFRTLVNLKSGNQLGASQVTSIVKQTKKTAPANPLYPVSFIAELVYPYVVEFRQCSRIAAKGISPEEMIDRAWKIQESQFRERNTRSDEQLRMFG